MPWSNSSLSPIEIFHNSRGIQQQEFGKSGFGAHDILIIFQLLKPLHHRANCALNGTCFMHHWICLVCLINLIWKKVLILKKSRRYCSPKNFCEICTRWYLWYVSRKNYVKVNSLIIYINILKCIHRNQNNAWENKTHSSIAKPRFALISNNELCNVRNNFV